MKLEETRQFRPQLDEVHAFFNTNEKTFQPSPPIRSSTGQSYVQRNFSLMNKLIDLMYTSCRFDGAVLLAMF